MSTRGIYDMNNTCVRIFEKRKLSIHTAHKTRLTHCLHSQCLLLYCVFLLSLGCAQQLELDDSYNESAKARADWPDVSEFPKAQDLAILFPRSSQLKIDGSATGLLGRPILPRRWIQKIGESFNDTVVLDAFLTESHYDDWHITAIRIVPCSPFGKKPSDANRMLCWPGVRVVWQPTIYNAQIRRRVVDAYSDDRAVHMLYDFLPAEIESEASTFVDALRAEQEVDFIRFVELRDRAIELLLEESFALRSNRRGGYGTPGYRSELTQSFDVSAKFLSNVTQFFARNLALNHVHTVTAFSLPEGRLPGPIGLWTFVAFEARGGQIEQVAIEIVDPDTGDIVGRLEKDETVGIAEGDQRLIDQMDGSEEGDVLADQVIVNRADINRLADKINDPSKTMIANTSCGTCHNFNRILFDFHNLSYFEAQEITVAPRVRNDVTHELAWVEQWLEETSDATTIDTVSDVNTTTSGNDADTDNPFFDTF